MEIKILIRTGNELKIEIHGGGHTFCNVVQKTLLKDKHVDLAGYDAPHPLAASPTIFLRTKGQNRPETVLHNAVSKVLKDTEAFGAAFDKALKKWAKL